MVERMPGWLKCTGLDEQKIKILVGMRSHGGTAAMAVVFLTYAKTELDSALSSSS